MSWRKKEELEKKMNGNKENKRNGRTFNVFFF